MNELEFAVSVLDRKKEEVSKSISWLIEKIRKEPDNTQWRKMVSAKWKKRTSLRAAIIILKEDWDFKK